MANIPAEVVRAYQRAYTDKPKYLEEVLALALRDELARRLEAEHDQDAPRMPRSGEHLFKLCERCDWQFADWQAEAHRILMGQV